MNRFLRILAVTLLVCFSPAHAQQAAGSGPAHLDSVARMVRVSSLAEILLIGMRDGLAERQKTNAPFAQLTAGLLDNVDAAMAEQRIARVFAPHVPAGHAEAIIQFFETPTGRKAAHALLARAKRLPLPNMTPVELAQLNAFAVTSAGQTWSNLNTAANDELRRAVREWVEELIAERRARDPNAPSDVSVAAADPAVRPFLELSKSFAERFRQIDTAFTADTAAIDMDSVIAPSTLVSLEKIESSRRNLAAWEQKLEAYLNAKTAMQQEFHEQSKRLGAPGTIRDEYLKGFERGLARNYDLQLRFSENQRTLLNLYRNLLSLAASRSGKIRIENNRLVFDEQSDLDSYRSLSAQIQEAAKAEKVLSEEGQARQQRALDMFRDAGAAAPATAPTTAAVETARLRPPGDAGMVRPNRTRDPRTPTAAPKVDSSRAGVAPADGGADRPNELARIMEAIQKIRENFLEVPNERTLVAGCRNAVLEATKATEAREDAGSDDVARAIARILEDASRRGGNRAELTDTCLHGLVASLDAQSQYFDEDEFTDLIAPRGGIAGIGLELRIEGELPVVVSVIESGPAQKIGMKAGDMLASIDGVPTRGVALKDIVKRLRGTVGSAISLRIVRASESLDLEMQRDLIRIESVKSESLRDGIGYIRIMRFQEQTPQRVALAVRSLYSRNGNVLRGLILDLRDNTGGLLHTVVGVSAAFLPDASVVAYTAGRSADSKMKLEAAPRFYLRQRTEYDYNKSLPPAVKTVPLMVLVNKATASGAEILAAAFQDHKRALVLGVPTHGMTTIQTVFPLRGKTGLKITSARFLRPTGMSLTEAGVTPDIAHENASAEVAGAASEDPLVNQAIRQLQVAADNPARASR